MINNRYRFTAMPALLIILIMGGIFGCALFRNITTDDFTKQCSHCHGESLEGINNVKVHCGECHDISEPLAPENISDEGMKEAVSSEPHIHKIRNVFTGAPSCFFCHRKGEF